MTLQDDMVKEIHKTPQKVVLAIAGGGAEAIGRLLRHGGGSQTLLEAVVPYSQGALCDFLKTTPRKFVSEDVAAQLATAAFCRAIRFSNENPELLAGISVTCSLAKENEREGRTHDIWIGVQKDKSMYTRSIRLDMIREDEESYLAEALICEIASHCGIANSYPTNNLGEINSYIPYNPLPLSEFLANSKKVSRLIGDRYDPKSVIMPGSFNPITTAHLKIAELANQAARKMGWVTSEKVDFELSCTNFDKPCIGHKAILDRLENFKVESLKNPLLGNLWLTNTALFIEKAEAFKGCVFVMGGDTLERLVGKLADTLFTFEKNSIKLVIVPRPDLCKTYPTAKSIKAAFCRGHNDKWIKVIADEDVPKEILGVSSTKLRNAVC